MAKVNHSSRKIAPKSTNWTKRVEEAEIVDRYHDTYEGSDHRVTEDDIKEWGKKLIRYGEEKNAYKLSPFYLRHRIPKSTFYVWYNKFDHFKNAVDATNEMIGNRREELGLMKDASFAYKTMSRYDKWYEEREEKEHQRRMEQKSAGAARIDSELIQSKIDEYTEKSLGPITKKQKEQHEQRIRSKTKDTV